MPISQNLLELLACPENHSPLRYADEATIARLNLAIQEGSLTTRGGRPVSEPLREALVRADGTVLYPIVDGIPIMMIDEGILLSAAPSSPS